MSFSSEQIMQIMQIMQDSLLQAFQMVWNAAQPIIISVFVSGMILLVIEKILTGAISRYCRLIGDSKREAKRKTKKVESIIELISATKDINDILRN